MSNGKLRYNERAWAIDLISHINENISSSGSIRRVSGERTLITGGNPLFPDVLLYADESSGQLLQGWELKMPDTSIDDAEFISNAAKKAKTLGLNSFVVWNVTEAVLYIFNDSTGTYEPHDEPLFSNPSITTRNDVSNHQDLWKSAANDIIGKLNRFFDGGLISGISPEIMFSGLGIVELFLSCQTEVKRYIEVKIQSDSEVDAKINVWWRHVKQEYPGENSPLGPLAYNILLGWFNRFIFSNILRAYTDSVRVLDSIEVSTSITEALDLFAEVADRSDFKNIFGQADFDHLIPDSVWDTFVSFNDFLKEFEFAKIDHAVLQNILKTSLLATIKKTAGLYITPEELAHLLVLLTLSDKSKIAIDPFCGTGTIVKAILSTKSDYNISGRDAVRSTWGCDKFAFPIKISTLAVSTPENMNETLRIFTHDTFDLEVGENIGFIDPSTGETIDISVPHFSAIISNLPFVQFEDLNTLNPLAVRKIEAFYHSHGIAESDKLTGRSDLYAYIPFLVYNLLEDNGNLGVIVSNSWISTGWGLKFRNLLKKFYSIRYVVTSANGRWFSNTDVVTNLLICQKKAEPDVVSDDNSICFVSVTTSLEAEHISDIASDIIAKSHDSTYITVNSASNTDIEVLNELGIGWTGCFSSIRWFLNNRGKFAPLRKFSTIARGERRGWNAMFYPSNEDCETIEDEFIKPVVKNLHRCQNFVVSPSHFAFCCSKSINYLEEHAKIGALNWINNFIGKTNGSGRPLPEVLKRSRLHWYQMDPATLADFVLSMSPNARLFVAKTPEPTFVDQRLIRITLNDDIDAELIYALLNSTISMYFIEALGFGRGLGVLDINATQIKKGFYVPNIELISQECADRIKRAFSVMQRRTVGNVLEEIERVDRRELDEAILESIEIPIDVAGEIYTGLKTIYQIRKSVEEN